jgi:hypothetical protein
MMKTKPVTFDSIDISVHKRYALDQEALDPLFIGEIQQVAHHSEITGTSSIFSSKWEDLFDIYKRNITWAHFSPPDMYYSQSNRFFSYCLLPDLYWDMNPEEDGTEKEQAPPVFFAFQRKKRPTKKQIVTLSSLMQKEASTPMIYFEKDKGIIMNLLDSIEKLNKMLAHVQSRKLQYQKG